MQEEGAVLISAIRIGNLKTLQSDTWHLILLGNRYYTGPFLKTKTATDLLFKHAVQ